MLPTVANIVSKKRVSVENRRAWSGFESQTSRWHPLSEVPIHIAMTRHPMTNVVCEEETLDILQRCSTYAGHRTNGWRVSCACSNCRSENVQFGPAATRAEYVFPGPSFWVARTHISWSTIEQKVSGRRNVESHSSLGQWGVTQLGLIDWFWKY